MIQVQQTATICCDICNRVEIVGNCVYPANGVPMKFTLPSNWTQVDQSYICPRHSELITDMSRLLSSARRDIHAEVTKTIKEAFDESN